MTDLFKKILVPTDNSENAKEAFKYALKLAEKHDSTIYVVAVVNIGYLEEAGKFESNHFKLPHSYVENIVKEKTKETEEFVRKNSVNYRGSEIARHIRKGHPVTEIISIARKKEVDLIVMGTHGRSGLSHTLMGSVAERVVRKASCPVLTVKSKKLKIKAA